MIPPRLMTSVQRAVERNISEQEIREAGAKAEIVEEYPEDKYSPSALLLGISASGRPLHFQVANYRVLCHVAKGRPPGDWSDVTPG